MKIFQLSDCEWYAGEDLESVIRLAEGYHLTSREDIVNKELCHELTRDELDTSVIYIEPEDKCYVFGEWLQVLEDRGETFPCFFAGTDV